LLVAPDHGCDQVHEHGTCGHVQEGRLQQDERRHPGGVPGGQFQRDQPAERVADDVGALDIEEPEQAGRIPDLDGNARGPR
jgi:hypothetical protein